MIRFRDRQSGQINNNNEKRAVYEQSNSQGGGGGKGGGGGNGGIKGRRWPSTGNQPSGGGRTNAPSGVGK